MLTLSQPSLFTLQSRLHASGFFFFFRQTKNISLRVNKIQRDVVAESRQRRGGKANTRKEWRCSNRHHISIRAGCSRGGRHLEDLALTFRHRDQPLPPHPTDLTQGVAVLLGSSGEGQSAKKSMSHIHSTISAWPGQAGEQGHVSKPTLLSATLSIWSLAELQNSRVTSFCTSASCYLQRGSS